MRSLVTGAAGGLGETVVRRLQQDAATIFAVDQEFPAPVIGNEIRLTGDLANPEDVQHIAAEVSQLVPGLDLLINCAGVFVPDGSPERIYEDIGYLFRNNVTSMILLSLQLEPLLAAGTSPSVVNISSTDAVVASAGQDCEIGVAHDVLYATTKGAVLTFTRALAMKWAPLGIRVNAVCPTIFSSPMTADLIENVETVKRLIAHLPLGAMPASADVAEAIMSLHAMRFTTGHALPVDGGYLCH